MPKGPARQKATSSVSSRQLRPRPGQPPKEGTDPERSEKEELESEVESELESELEESVYEDSRAMSRSPERLETGIEGEGMRTSVGPSGSSPLEAPAGMQRATSGERLSLLEEQEYDFEDDDEDIRRQMKAYHRMLILQKQNKKKQDKEDVPMQVNVEVPREMEQGGYQEQRVSHVRRIAIDKWRFTTKFNGTGIDEAVNCLDEMQTFMDCYPTANVFELTFVARQGLTGTALSWMNGWLRTHPHATNWEEFKVAFLKNYLDENKQEDIRNEFFRIARTGTVDQYVEEFQKLRRHYELFFPPLPPMELQCLFLTGVRYPNVTAAVRSDPGITLEDLTISVKHIAGRLERAQAAAPPTGRKEKNTERSSRANQSSSHRRRTWNSSRRTPEEIAELMATGACFICKETTHKSNNCPKRKTRQVRPEEVRLTASSVEFAEPTKDPPSKETPTILVKCAQSEQELRTTRHTVALIDTGASTNLVSVKTLKELQLRDQIVPLAKLAPPLKQASTGLLHAVGKITLDLHYEDKEPIPCCFYVIDGLSHEMILGYPFIHENAKWIQALLFGVGKPEVVEEIIEKSEVGKETNQKVSGEESGPIYWTTPDHMDKELKDKENVESGYLDLRNTQMVNAVKVDEVKVEGPNIPDFVKQDYPDVVTSKPPDKMPTRNPVFEHTIELIEGQKPPARPPYRLTTRENEELGRQLQELDERGFISLSASPFSAPVLFVKKKDGSMRLCIDYRSLNEQTVKNRYPLPLIDDLLDQLQNAKWFSKLDLMSGYHQIPIASKDRHKTAFSTTRFGHYEWNVMPFGLTNAPATFQKVMNDILRPLLGKSVIVYLDDILIFSPDEETHKTHIKEVLEILRKHQFIAKMSKCTFFEKSVPFLGYIVSDKGLSTDPAKVEAVRHWKEPRKSKETLAFLGLVNFYRRFIPRHSRIAAPLNAFASGKCEWSIEQTEAFEELKMALTSAPTLVLPKLPVQDTYCVVTTDACDIALSAILEEYDAKTRKSNGVVAYASYKLKQSELNYPTREKEFFAIIFALKQWRYYLKDTHFVIKTDHQSLQYLKSQKAVPNGRLTRWMDFLAEYQFDITYVPGSQNAAADAMSRLPALEFEEELLVNVISTITPDPERREELINGYQKDSAFQEIYEVLDKQMPPPEHLKNHMRHYSLGEDRLLYFRAPPVNEPFRLCIPQSTIRDTILYDAHDAPVAGHGGYLKTYDLVSRAYYWPNMTKTIKKYCRSCTVCQTTKASTQKPPGLLHPLDVPRGRWQDVSMDFVTGIPTTGDRNDMILVVVDRLTKRAHFIACRKTDGARDLAYLFFTRIVALHGLPTTIVSDKDIRYMNLFWTSLMRVCGTKMATSTTNHAQTDGQTERVNRTLNQYLRAFINQDMHHWDYYLPLIEFAYNSTYQASIRASPFYADLGYDPKHPGLDTPFYPLGGGDDFAELPTRLKALMRQTQDFMVQAQRSNENAYNKDHRHLVFEVGEWVLVDRTLYGKFELYVKTVPLFWGPVKVVKKISDTAYELDLPEVNKRLRTVNIKFLKKFHARESYPNEPPRTDAHAKYRIHEINQVVGRDVTKGQFLVNWRDCDPTITTIVYESWMENANPALKARLTKLWDNAIKRGDVLSSTGENVRDLMDDTSHPEEATYSRDHDTDDIINA